MTELPHQLKEIYWRSRRGMLELELRLVPFVRDCFESLSEAEQAVYVEMLAEEDWQIFDCVRFSDGAHHHRSTGSFPAG